MWSPCGNESVSDVRRCPEVASGMLGRSIGFVWLENARLSSRPVAFRAPPTSLVRSNFGVYCASLDAVVSTAVGSDESVTSLVASRDAGTPLVASRANNGSNFGEPIGSVGSNNPGPSNRLTGADASREVRRGTLVVLPDEVRAALFPALLAGLVDAGRESLVTGFALCAAGRGATNNRGDFSRRSSNVQPRGSVSLAAWSSHNRLR